MNNEEYGTLFQQASQLFYQEDYDKAEDICNQLIKINSKQSDVYNLLAIVKDKQNQLENSIRNSEIAINLNSNPNNLYLYYSNLGDFLRKKGDISKALIILEKSIELNPNFHTSKYNLANIHQILGNKGEAERLYEEVLKIKPDDYKSLNNLGLLYIDSPYPSLANEYYLKALKYAPDDIEIKMNVALSFDYMKDNYNAEYYYRDILFQEPNNIVAIKSLIVSLENASRTEESIELYKKYLDLTSSDHKDINISKQMHIDFTIPNFNLSNLEIDNLRNRLIKKMDKYLLIEKITFIQSIIIENLCPNIQLAYHGRNNKELKSKMSKIFNLYFSKNQVEAKLSFNQGKIKIGFLVTKLNEGIFIKFMEKIINNLPQDKFDIFIICNESGWNLKVKDKINGYIKPFFLPDSLIITELSEKIFELNLDILYHWEIGTDVRNYFLAFFRLAPIQCTSLGWPDTTGISNVDYFLSSELIETEDAQNNYTEKLVKFKKLPFNYQKPELNEFKTLEEFELPTDKNIYFCCQNLRKIHPDFDYLIANILRKDLNGVIIFIKSKIDNITNLLKNRLKTTSGDIFNRVIFLEDLPYQEYLSLTKQSTVMLDSLYFGGANTSYESFAMNTPVVTFPWAHERGRYTLGCYKQMGIEGLVANSFDEYIELAVKTASDKEFRNNLVQQIKKNNHKLFDDMDIIKEYTEFFQKIARE